jgi:hypothetical protein
MLSDLGAGEFTLESILAEYKGSAFIDGDKRTPQEDLDMQADKIIKEVTGVTDEDDTSDHQSYYANLEAVNYDDTEEDIATTSDNVVDTVNLYEQGADATPSDSYGLLDLTEPDDIVEADTIRPQAPPVVVAADTIRPQIQQTPHVTVVADTIRPQTQQTSPVIVGTDTIRPQTQQTPQVTVAADTIRPQTQPISPELYEEQDIERPPVMSEDSSGQIEEAALPVETEENASEPQSEEVVYKKISPDELSASQDLNVEDVEEAINREFRYDDKIDEKIKNPGILGRFKFYEDEIYDEELFEEPDLKDAMKRFNIAASSITLRSAPAVIIAIFMLVLTLAFEAGWVIPFGIGRVQSTAVIVLLLGLLIIMMLCVDIVVRVAVFLIRGRANIETLILFSCVFSIFSGVFSILRDSPGVMTYAAVSAFSLAIAAVGEKYNLRAMTETLKTAAIVSEPFGLLTDYNSEIDKSVLKKVSNRTDGFYNNLMHPDVVETAYRFTAPLLLAGSLILAVVTALVRGHGEYFLYILNALLAAAAPFSALVAFAIPFRVVSKSIRKSGTAISGWGGADEMCFTDGACVTDEDLFPPGTLSFSSTKLYDHVPHEKAIAYAASLVITSGSGVGGIFAEALKQHRLKPLKVEDFNCYEGGIGGRIHGEQVAAGSAAFMNLLGIRIPDELNMKNAVYTSVNNKLAAIFVIDYLPLKSVQGALRSILKWKIKLFFAMRDFNVTPLMLEQKFKISLKDVEFLQARESYDISEQKAEKSGRMAAVLNREGLAPFAEAVTGGKLLKTTSYVSTAISIFSAILGVLIMTYLFWMGAFVSANPGNLLLYMLAMLGIVLAVCGYAKFGK